MNLLTRLIHYSIITLLISSGAALIYSAIVSLNWRYFHDAPIMIYCAYLIDSGFIPYKDFFDMNMPGIYFINLIGGKIFGWSDMSFRIFDLVCLAILLILTIRWVKPFGKLSSYTAAVVFGLYYLNNDQYVILQREYFALLPLALTLVLTTNNFKIDKKKILVLIGVLSGCSFLIKPQFLIISVSIVSFVFYQNRRNISIGRQILFLISGFLTPVAITLIYLAITGGLLPFLDIVVNYWNLYSQMNAEHRIISMSERLYNNLNSIIFGLDTPLLPLALMGILVLSYETPKNKYIPLLILLLLSTIIYPVVAGLFFDYQWIPFSYVAICEASIILKLLQQKIPVKKIILFPAVIILFVPLLKTNIGYSIKYSANEEEINKEKFSHVDEIKNFLSANLKEGERVQSLDWTGGSLNAMLNSNAKTPTRFIYDFHFYHHLDDPYIQNLRKEFITSLNQNKPKYIVEMSDKRPWPVGQNTSRNFDELKNFINENYQPVRESDVYIIYQHK